MAEFLDSLEEEEIDDTPEEDVTCKHCGTEGLTWYEVKHGDWRLYDAKFHEHKCSRPMFEDETCTAGSAGFQALKESTGAASTSTGKAGDSTTATPKAAASGASTHRSPTKGTASGTKSPRTNSTDSDKKAGRTVPPRSRSKR